LFFFIFYEETTNCGCNIDNWQIYFFAEIVFELGRFRGVKGIKCREGQTSTAKWQIERHSMANRSTGHSGAFGGE
jgi:hypothetical protein